jgi:hypothetical protein
MRHADETNDAPPSSHPTSDIPHPTSSHAPKPGHRACFTQPSSGPARALLPAPTH